MNVVLPPFLTYLGGKFVFGIGSSWPHDFLFLAGFFSSFFPAGFSSGSREVAEGEIVSGITSEVGVPGVPGKEPIENVSSIVTESFRNWVVKYDRFWLCFPRCR